MALSALASLIFPQVWMLVAGLVAGSCLRDLGYVRSARAVWPVSFTVIDWPKVDDLLADSKPQPGCQKSQTIEASEYQRRSAPFSCCRSRSLS